MMIKKYLPSLCSFFFMAAGFYSCKTQTAPVTPQVTISCSDPIPSFTNEIKPILDANCATTCHSGKNKAAGIDLSIYENVKAISANKKFLGSIRHERGYAPMPRKNPKLSEGDILKIACWIQAGSLR